MSAADLVRLTTDVLFVLVFVRVLVAAIADRRQVRLDTALFFGALAWILLQSEVTRAVGITLPPIVSDLSAALLLAMPYLLVRLVDELVGTPAWAPRAALAGFLASAAALFVLPQELPLPAALAIVAYFGLTMIYAAILLARGTRHTSGVVHRRTQAAAAGSVLLGAAILAAGLQAFVPFVDSITRVLVLVSALAYVAGFATPALLKRAWREPELRAFLAHVSAISPREDPTSIASQIEAAASLATGGTAVLVLRSPGDEPPPIPTPLDREAVAAPMIARGRGYGTLVVRLRREPLFPDDEQALVTLLAHQGALVLDGARLYQELSDANRALTEATSAKSEFLANMSHELRTPMNAILGFSDLLMEQLADRLTPSQQRYFRNIKDAGAHLLELINEVLDLSKVEAGRLDLRPEPLRVSALTGPVVESTRRAAEAKGIAFAFSAPEDPVVRVDPGRLRQVMYNLLSNAVKFTPPGGRVSLTVALEGDDLVFDVADSGIGIPADKRGRVFGTFERLHEDSVQESGTGLGLALTKKLIELHQGTITFESEEGRGTTFHVRIADAVFSPVTGERILVVDDTARDAELIAAVATQLGVATELVATAAAARDAVRRDPPLGVVLDLRLPDERGDVLLHELKSDPATRSIPILVMSVEDDEGRSRPLGADDHLTKPIDRDRAAAWIRKIAARRTAPELTVTR